MSKTSRHIISRIISKDHYKYLSGDLVNQQISTQLHRELLAQLKVMTNPNKPKAIKITILIEKDV